MRKSKLYVLMKQHAKYSNFFLNEYFVILCIKTGIEDLNVLYSVMNNKKESENDSDSHMVHPEGLEPTTLCSEDRCSNPLSYGCT